GRSQDRVRLSFSDANYAERIVGYSIGSVWQYVIQRPARQWRQHARYRMAASSAASRRHESAVGTHHAGRIAQVAKLEIQRAAQAPARLTFDEGDAERQVDDFPRCQADLAHAMQLERAFAKRHRVLAILLGLVDDLEAVHVFDLALAVLAVQ